VSRRLALLGLVIARLTIRVDEERIQRYRGDTPASGRIGPPLRGYGGAQVEHVEPVRVRLAGAQ